LESNKFTNKTRRGREEEIEEREDEQEEVEGEERGKELTVSWLHQLQLVS
jgi:hypothetical protein